MELCKRTDDSRIQIKEATGIHWSWNHARASVPREEDAWAIGRWQDQDPQARDREGGHGAACSSHQRIRSWEARKLAQDHSC